MAVVLVTGCSSGIGRALALGFLARGHDVVATMRRPQDGGDGVLRELAADPTCAVSLAALDVTDPASRRAAVDTVLARHGRIDVLVNNAGVLDVGAVEDSSQDATRRIFETNYFGPVALCRAVLPPMRKQGSGRIVNITAIGAVLSTPFLGSYCASKHAMDALTACLDLEVRPFGVRVSSVLPGSFRTAIADHEMDASDGPAYADRAGTFRAGFRSRIAQAPEDLSELVERTVEAATTAEPRARYVVGTGAADAVRPFADDLEILHRAEATRLGLD